LKEFELWRYARQQRVLLAALFIICLRLVFIFVMGPMPQDAYYFFYSAHPALSYFDHPPAIACLLRLFTFLFGKTVVALKLADSVATMFTIILFYQLAKCFLSIHAAQKALLLFVSTFMVTILSLVSTPDVPLLFFWSASLLALYRAIFLNKNIYWIWFGLLMGLSFDSKYTALLLPVGLLGFLLLSNQYRKKLLSPWLWMGLIISVAAAAPVIIWNHQHAFVSFRFQSSGRMNAMGKGLHFNVVSFLGVIGHQSAVLIPVLCFSFFLFLFKIIRKYKFNIFAVDVKTLFLLCFFIPTFVGFFLVSFTTWVKLNWMMPAYISGIIWVARYYSGKWVRVQVIVSAVIHLLLAVEVLFYPVLIRSDDTWTGWKQLSQKVADVKTAYPAAFVFSDDAYKTAAELNFYARGEMIYSGNVIGKPGLQFDFIGTDLNKLKGRDALMIDSDPMFKDDALEHTMPPLVQAYFDSIRELPPILIKQDARTIRKFLVYKCSNYHGLQTAH
jgi:4-amino-4-deoxy-L-arabinose transferase-like glycosyltransferase